MASKISLRVQSRVEKESSNISFTTYQIDAITLAGWLTAWAAFKTSTDAILRGTLAHESISIYDTKLSPDIPTDNDARRENKLLVRYTGNVRGKKYRMEIPCPDNSALTFESGDANFVNLADAGVMAAWVVDFEILAKAPDDDTEDVTIRSIQYVGRNL